VTLLVLGAGVSGLTCAAALLEAGHCVEIWARQLPPHTTSNVAAAFWFPYRAYPQQAVTRWSRISWTRFAELAREPATGITMRRAYDLSRVPSGRPWWADAVPTVRQATRDELPDGFGHGWAFDAPVVDMRAYLPWLVDHVQRRGATIVVRELESFEAAFARHDVVVNCTGLGARGLCHDDALVPIRGQIVHVTDPGLQAVLLDERDEDIAYVVPRGDDCVLGGTADVGRDDLDADPDDSVAIVERCARLCPALAGATKLADVVGLRPGRASVRVEAERPAADKLLVHDYGHGGAGVTLSWGCAQDVTSIVASATQARVP
jgi:D-amino-acid oxidase